MAQAENFPHLDEVKQELANLAKADLGNPDTPFSRVSAILSDELVAGMQQGIAYRYNCASLFDSMMAFFDRDNVGLPGVAFYFKVRAVEERNIAVRMIDYLNKRGARVHFGAIAAPPSDWTSKEHSDVLNAFMKALALAKVAYFYTNQAFELAQRSNDAHAVDFIGTAARLESEVIRTNAHYVAHLKAVETDKHAIKQFERRLICETEDLAHAAGIEATIPNRLMIGTAERANMVQTIKLGRGAFKESGEWRGAMERGTL